MFFTNRGRVYQPQVLRNPRGRAARRAARPSSTCSSSIGGEKVTRHAAHAADRAGGASIWSMATRMGLIKRTETRRSLPTCATAGLIAIVLREDDELIGVALTDGDAASVLLGTQAGHGHPLLTKTRCAADRPRRHGRQVHGTGRRRRSGRHVACVEEGAQVLSITAERLRQAHRDSTSTACRAAAARASRP